MLKWVDKHISPHLPNWVITLGVAIAFALLFAVPLGLVQSFVMLDISMLWSTWPRAALGVLTVVFYLVIAVQS
jgi:membrane protein YdbS with pleckstrin-like domain